MDTGVILGILLLISVAILLFLPTIWAIRNIAYGSFPTLKTKALWFALVTLLPPIGALIYIFIGQPRLRTETEQSEHQDVKAEVKQDETD